jgi:hypothetical protein
VTSIPDHVLQNAIVIVPRKPGLKGIVNLSSARVGLIIAVATSCFMLVMAAPVLSPKSISQPDWLLLALGCIPSALMFVFFSVVLGLRKSGLDIILGYDAITGEVVLAERRFGRPRAVFRVPIARVQAIRLYWQAPYSGTPDVGWWDAQLVLLDGKDIPLGNIKGNPTAPPKEWLARFKRVSALLDRPLEIPSFADGRQAIPRPLVDHLTNNIRQQSGSPGKPQEILARRTSARQTIYASPMATEKEPTVFSHFCRLYIENKTFRLRINLLLLGGCYIVAIAFTRMVGNNYWLHLLGESAKALLFTIAIAIGFFFMLGRCVEEMREPWTGLLSGTRKFQLNELLALAVYIFLLLVLLIAAILFIGIIVRLSSDLSHGPIYDKGIIERTAKHTNSVGYDSILVHGTWYDVPDRSWYKTMELGQEIEFLYSPITHYAYPPPQSQ